MLHMKFWYIGLRLSTNLQPYWWLSGASTNIFFLVSKKRISPWFIYFGRLSILVWLLFGRLLVGRLFFTHTSLNKKGVHSCSGYILLTVGIQDIQPSTPLVSKHGEWYNLVFITCCHALCLVTVFEWQGVMDMEG